MISENNRTCCISRRQTLQVVTHDESKTQRVKSASEDRHIPDVTHVESDTTAGTCSLYLLDVACMQHPTRNLYTVLDWMHRSPTYHLEFMINNLTENKGLTVSILLLQLDFKLQASGPILSWRRCSVMSMKCSAKLQKNQCQKLCSNGNQSR